MANDKKFIAKNGIQGLDASVFTSITTSGKVGVGTASPVAGLDVLGTSGYTGTIHNHLYASGEGVRIFGNEATLDLLGQDTGDHASSVYFRNGTEGFAWINDPDSDSFQLRSFTSTGNDFNAHGTGSAISNLVSILDISKTGNVGIGTDAPGEKLDVNGDAIVRGSGGTIGGANIANASLLVGSTSNGIGIDTNEIYTKGDHLYLGVLDATSDIHFRYGNTKLVTIKSGGNVGIGTDSPDRALTIEGSDFSSSTIRLKRTGGGANNDAGLQFESAAGANADTGMGGIWFQNSLDGNAYALMRARTDDATGTSGRLDFMTGTSTVSNSTTPRMTIKGDGKVGIGTSNPNADFHIAQGPANRVMIESNGPTLVFKEINSTNQNWQIYHNAGDLHFNTLDDSFGSISTKLKITNSGNVGIGTDNPSSKLDVRGSLGANGTAATPTAYFVNNQSGATSGSIYIGASTGIDWKIGKNVTGISNNTNFSIADSSNNRRLDIDSSGNVGIGITNPGYKLDVAGNLRLQSATDVILDLNADTGNTSGEAYHPEVRFWQDGGVGSNLMLAIGSDNAGGAYTGTLANSAFIMGGSGHSGSIPLHFGVNNTVYATMESSGNLGIGITNPQDPLVVKSSGTMGGAVTNANSYFTITDGTTSLYHDPNELVTDASGSFHIAANNAAGELQFQTGGTTARMQIKSDGKVGIGTVTPSNVLHVHGADSGITVSADASDRPHIRLVNGTAEMLRLSANNLYGAIGDSSNSQRYMVFKNDFIGTNTQTAPNAQIHIGTATAEGTAVNPALQIGGANTYRLGFYTQAELGVIDAANGDSGLAIHTKTIGEAVRINADGEVGIGTNNPFGTIHTRADNTRIIFGPGATGANLAAQHRLEFWEGTPTDANSADANYAIEYDGTATYGGDGAFLFRGYGSAANQVFGGINRQGTAFFGMNGASPRVGIGTTNPTNKLDIRGNVTQIDGSPEYHFATSSATHYNWRIAAQEQVSQSFEIASGELTAGTSADSDTYTNRLVINANGNVGIGTNSPGSRLEIYNSATAGNTQLHIHNDKTGDAAVIRLEGGRTSSNDATQINFANTGNIGSAIRMYSAGSNEGDMRFYTSVTGTGDATQERMRIEPGGNVGIGTADATAKLHVWGSTILQGDSGVTIRSTSNNPTNGAILYFTDTFPTQSQTGFIKYKHADSSVVSGSNEQMVFGGDQPISDFLFEGDVHSTGDVVAYFSDPRLKDFHGNITGALDKVNSLGGYYFTENELAKEIGYRNDRMQVGVNADEVEAVLPEVVTTALVNENIPQDEVRDYKTVKYEKMVPLLIEAIKELTEQNMEMKQRLDKLEGEA